MTGGAGRARRNGAVRAAALTAGAALVLAGCAEASGGVGGSGASTSPDSRWKVHADKLTGTPSPYTGPPSIAPGPRTPNDGEQLPEATPTACPDTGVAVVTGVVDAAMGRRATTIRLTNCGKKPYRVEGYPQIGALDKDRDPLKLKVTHGAYAYTDSSRDQGPRPLTLAPGKSAVSVLNWNNRVTSFDAVRPGAYLVVAPVRGEKEQTVPFFLDIGTSAELDVTAWAFPREEPGS
ncbi:DUF4232 domain-containing protein [Streptomyces sp. NPDC008141]|uniref:DUF4232 domain-containing protein n=1 Tax=Streptomyces sp. NPDC008141 TaxID=3364815 RepID=UPI0036EE1106